MGKIIAISNLKGGVAKTTTAINLGHGLALRGKQVLMIDLDPQAHISAALGLQPEAGVFYLLTMGLKAHENEFVKGYVRSTGRERLWLIPGDASTNHAQLVLDGKKAPFDAIREALGRFRGEYRFDYIILDTAPSVGGILERALWAADLVIVPTTCEYLSTDSVKQMKEMLEKMGREDGWRGRLMGVLPTMLHDQIKEHKAALEDLRKGFGDQVLGAIHRAAVLAECPGENRTIFEKDAGCRAAKEYAALVKAVLRA
jgi:chromosome partitioning protein